MLKEKATFGSAVLAACLLLSSCVKDDLRSIPFRQEMRNFIQDLSEYAKNEQAGFIIIPQNGHELLFSDNELTSADESYINSIDGVGQEELLYGWDNKDNQSTDLETTAYLKNLLDKAKEYNKKVLVTDYTDLKSQVDQSFYVNDSAGYISFAAPDRDMRSIPAYPLSVYRENAASVSNLNQARNFLYLINTEFYPDKNSFRNAVNATNYDLIIMDYFIGDSFWTAEEIESMKTKANGGRRLLISYMSIGEAENYRWYWQNGWRCGDPEWIEKENRSWKGNFKVRYWYTEWKEIIYGSPNAYLDRIQQAGFDGAYLDIVDAWEYFEARYY